MKSRIYRLFVIALILAFLTPISELPSTATASTLQVIYSNNFEGTIGPEWSKSITDITPTGNRKYLGQFGSETVSLSLNNLPIHRYISITFDLFIIRTWDGNRVLDSQDHCCIGPDIWDLSTGGGNTLLHTTFSNINFPPFGDYPQAYPDAYNSSTSPNHSARTGAQENNTLGYTYSWGYPYNVTYPVDSVYHLTMTFPHTESNLILRYSASLINGGAGLTDESWGLDNVIVRGLENPDSGFRPDPDGYQFNNQPRPLPSWNTFKQTFSNSSLEYPFGIPKPLAWAFYELTYRRAFGGMCDGMSSSALAYYQNIETRPGGTTSTYGLSPNDAWPLIELYHGRQLSKGLQNYRNNLWQNHLSVDNVYNQIKSQLLNHANEPLIMTIVPGPNNSIPQNQRFGHAVIPYRIEEDQASTWGKVFVYDPNIHGDINRYFYFDFSSSPHTFDYDMGGPIPSNSGGNYHVNSRIGWIVELVPLSQFNTTDAKVLHDGFFGWLIGSGEVVHTNSIGESIGYQQGVFTSTIPNAAPIYDWISLPFDGGAFGVSLPANTYQVSISSSGSYEYSASSLTNAVDIKIQADNIASKLAPTDILDNIQIDDLGSVTYSSTATSSRTLSLQITGNDSIMERQYGIANTTTSGPTMLQAQLVSNGLSIHTSGITSTFDLSIRGPEGFVIGWFVHDGITITSGLAITIEAPNISPSSVITVTTSLGEQWILENQLKQLYLPTVTR